MKINVKIKKVVAQREWVDKTGENRKVVEVIAEEITNEAYKDQFLVSLFDSNADKCKEGDAVVMHVGFVISERWYTNKQGEQAVDLRQKVTGFSISKL